MKSLTGLVPALIVTSIGIGVTGFQPSLVWAGQATEHDHTHGADAPATPAAPQTPAPPDGQQMSTMRQDMMARMSALDDQIKALGVEMNAAKTTDAKLAAVTKLLNVFIEQRSMMRMQMDMQGKMMEQMMSMHQMMQHMMSASPAGSATQPNGNDKVPH
jgi:ribosomal protein L12E/L44/L45/RPP1/RPP2